MPHYDYHCDDCDNTYEVFQKMTEEPLTICQKCGGTHVKRLLGGGAGIIFKGSGFYINDYKNSAGSGSSEKNKEHATETSSKTESKSETQSESTSEKNTESSSNKVKDKPTEKVTA